MRAIQSITAVALLLWGTLSANAAVFCVANGNDLQAALSTASSNAANNTIKVQTGTYNAPSGGFVYSRASGNQNLNLEGGFDSGCNTQSFDSSLTVIDGQSIHRLLRVQNANGLSGNITVRYFTFLHGLNENNYPASLDAVGYDGDVRVENCRFRLNTSAAGGFSILNVSVHDGKVYFLDNAVTNNTAPDQSTVLDFNLYDFATSNATGTFYVNNNTIADNAFGTGPDGALAAMYLFPDAGASLANNILWGNGGNNEIYLCCSTRPTLLNNDIDVLLGMPNPASSGNISIDPQFVSDTNHHVLGTSPAVNAGVNDPPGTTRTIDLDGNPRIMFGTVDMGAYERQTLPDEIFADGFDG